MAPICVNYSYVPFPLQNYSSSHGLSGAKEELNRNLVCDTLHVPVVTDAEARCFVT
jgi:hypothetical protein